MAYRSANKTVYSAKYRLIWCPKYRCWVLAGRVDQRLKEIIDEVVIEVEVMPDLVDLMIELPPPVPLSMLVQKLKGRSSKLLRAGFAELRRLPALWSPSWFVSAAGGAALGVVRGCVENQIAAA